MDASTKIKEELKSMQSRIGELLTEFAKQHGKRVHLLFQGP